jgi:hypothetical protein
MGEEGELALSAKDSSQLAIMSRPSHSTSPLGKPGCPDVSRNDCYQCPEDLQARRQCAARKRVGFDYASPLFSGSPPVKGQWIIVLRVLQ